MFFFTCCGCVLSQCFCLRQRIHLFFYFLSFYFVDWLSVLSKYKKFTSISLNMLLVKYKVVLLSSKTRISIHTHMHAHAHNTKQHNTLRGTEKRWVHVHQAILYSLAGAVTGDCLPHRRHSDSVDPSLQHTRGNAHQEHMLHFKQGYTFNFTHLPELWAEHLESLRPNGQSWSPIL